MQFQYQAADAQGNIVRGRAEADSREQLITRLKSQGKFPLEVKEDSQIISIGSRKKSKLSRQERLKFTQQLAGLLTSGIPLERSLNILNKLQLSSGLSNIISELRRYIQEGLSFTAALQRFPGDFPPIYINMVQAGEAGGILPQVLHRLAQYLEDEINLRRFITGSLFYPSIVVTFTLAAILFYVGVVVPKFEMIFQDMGSDLPVVTQMIILFGKVLGTFWWVIPVLGIGAFIWYTKELSTPKGKYRIDSLKFKIPLVGPLLQKISTARMAMALSLLNGSGVPILASLNIASEIVENAMMSKALKEVEQSVKRGNSLAHSMTSQNAFPILAVEMISVGEESGTMGEMLDQVAKTYEGEVKHALSIFMSVFEPLLIILMVGIIAILAVAILLPIVNMNTELGG